jgi:hypothetical protein
MTTLDPNETSPERHNKRLAKHTTRAWSASRSSAQEPARKKRVPAFRGNVVPRHDRSVSTADDVTVERATRARREDNEARAGGQRPQPLRLLGSREVAPHAGVEQVLAREVASEAKTHTRTDNHPPRARSERSEAE